MERMFVLPREGSTEVVHFHSPLLRNFHKYFLCQQSANERLTDFMRIEEGESQLIWSIAIRKHNVFKDGQKLQFRIQVMKSALLK